eukprot:GFKZ01006292.1.p1 GENE.GFKZ01006292.1~~GFKZ01006292.1.p1  ORF type:complete len:276 (+),score=50.24 GFKZ01006292.1:195-1022(+)
MVSAFLPPSPTSTFTGQRVVLAKCPIPVTTSPARQSWRMQGGGRKGPLGGIFGGGDGGAKDDATTRFMEPQAGDPGYTPLPPVPKGFGMTKSEPKGETKEAEDKTAGGAAAKSGTVKGTVVSQKGAKGRSLPVTKAAEKRGLDLLREDVLKSAPERVGVGRQDAESVTMKPVAGEPGYKPESFQTVKVSELGISPFPDDANAVGKVGGLEAVRKAAVDVKQGKTAKEIKKAVLKPDIAKVEAKGEAKVYDIPDYLKPIPEDSPRKGLTWKNYKGR